MSAATTPEERLRELGIELPPPFADEANRVRALRSGNLVFMSGHGFSDLMVEIFGENGRHTRAAIGAAELYADIPVEIEATFEIAADFPGL